MRNSTRNWLFVPLAAFALAWTGCGDDDDDKSTGPSGDGEEITAANIAEVNAAVTQALTNAAAKGPGTHDGAESGKVKVEISVGKLAQVGGITMNIDFDNYSDDGETWIDGKISYIVSGTSISYSGDLTISGTYSGRVQIDISAGPTGASGTYTVNGETITL